MFLAWAGNRATGLERAFFARPYRGQDGKLYWSGPIEELDIEQGRAFALPGVEDAKEPPRHSLDFAGIADIAPPPAFGLELLDTDADLDPTELFSAGPHAADSSVSTALDDDDIDEDDDIKGEGADTEGDESHSTGETGPAR